MESNTSDNSTPEDHDVGQENGGKVSGREETSPKISEALPSFLEYLKVEENLTAGTLAAYRRHVERFGRVVGDRPVTAINAETVALYKRRLIEAGLSPATMSGMLACLRTFLKYLREIRQLAVYDAERVRRPKIPRREVEYLSNEEVQKFLAAIPTRTLVGLRDRALIEVLCSTGMRISEALSLDRSAINWESREARIVGKGNKQRKVYFGGEAIDWLERYLERRRDENPAVFATTDYEPRRLMPGGTWRRFRRYGRLAGLGRVYPHMLRHTMATMLLANGCPIGHIRTLLGHAHLATTCRYYLGRISEAEAKAAHAKYLSYEVERRDNGTEVSTGRENIRGEDLTKHAA